MDCSKVQRIAKVITSTKNPQRALDFFYEQYEMLETPEILLLHSLCADRLTECARDDSLGGEVAAMDDALNGRQ